MSSGLPNMVEYYSSSSDGENRVFISYKKNLLGVVKKKKKSSKKKKKLKIIFKNENEIGYKCSHFLGWKYCWLEGNTWFTCRWGYWFL